jgi:hypothetical protein
MIVCVWVVPVSNYRLETGDTAIGKPWQYTSRPPPSLSFPIIIHSRFAIRCYITCAIVEVSLHNSRLNAVLHPFIYLLINSICWLIKDVHFMWTRLAFPRPCSTLFMHNVREYTELHSPSNYARVSIRAERRLVSWYCFPLVFYVPLSQVCMDYWCLETALSGPEINSCCRQFPHVLAYFMHCISKLTQQHFLLNIVSMCMLYGIGPDLYVSIFGPRATFKHSNVAVDNRLFTSHIGVYYEIGVKVW